MRALRYHGPGDLRLEHGIPEPCCSKTQVKVRPAFVGICGTDLHEYSTPTFIPDQKNTHPVTGESRPVIIGHEMAGTIVEIGADINNKSIKVGDRVSVRPTVCCFTCPSCEEGHYSCCATPGFLGLSGGGGGLSDYICVESDFVHKLPDTIGLDIGALVEPLATCWRAVVRSGIKNGDDVLVFGAGPIGLGVIQCCKAQGANNIIVAEVAVERRRLAKEFGATLVFNPLESDIVRETKKATHREQGADASFDCAGLEATLKAACLATRPRGVIVNVAIWEKPIEFNPNLLVFGERVFYSVLGYDKNDFEGVLNAIESGALKPGSMITRKISIDRVVEDGFRALIEEKDKHVKIQIDLLK
ncbi:unnamed protein product [Clonostachys solani]|uniref:Enoyl reductase (ER) domain-containing protein n=1 Tax=Clonostachys solani TaxID=160281 RepID=A0A9N9ZIU3_9HYPO|nr:unnamed protein product [Clonostachys solani]